MKIRFLLKKIHFWIGITVGFITSFTGITGSLYLWKPEISAFFAKKELNADNSQKLNYKEYINTAKKLQITHKDSLTAIHFPYRERQSIRLDFKSKNSYYYHPNTGAYLGKNPFSITFFNALLQLHRNLLLGKIGKYIIGTSTLIFAFLILGSGFYLWHRIYKNRWRKGLLFKKSKNPKKNNFNIHRFIGIYGLIPLFIIAITGAYFTFHSQYKELLYVIPSFDKKNNPSLVIPKKDDIFNFDETVQNLVPHYYIRSILKYTTDKGTTYRYRFINSLPIQSGLRKSTDIIVNTKQIVEKVSSYETFNKAEKITAQMYPIHIGESLGIINRIFVFLSGFIPVILYITGLRFYLFRKRKIKKQFGVNPSEI